MGLGGPHMSPPQQDPFLSTNLPHITMRNLISEMTARKGGQKKRQERSDRERHVEREAIEEQMAAEQMAAEEEADHKEASERDHAAYLEEAYRCRVHPPIIYNPASTTNVFDSFEHPARRRLEANEEKVTNSRFSSNSSPDSQSPSPPTSSSNGGSDSPNISNNDNPLYIENTLKKYSSPKHEGSLSSKHESLSSRRSYWKSATMITSQLTN